MSSSSAGLFYPGSIGRVSEAETCSEQTGREKRILLSSPYAIALPAEAPASRRHRGDKWIEQLHLMSSSASIYAGCFWSDRFVQDHLAA